MSLPEYTQKISAEAGMWLARLQADDLSGEDEAAFRAWLAADAAHAAAFEHATNVWDRLGGIPREQYVSHKKPASLMSRRALVAGLAGVALVGSAVPFFRGAQARVYQTMVGQQTRIPLDDGSELFLDTNTAVAVTFSAERRLVELQRGRINCRVAQNESPFAVKAADRLVFANRSVFDVCNLDGYFSVLLLNGSADVAHRGSGPALRLRQGDRAISQGTKPLQRDRPDLAVLTAWQTGRLVFKDQSILDAVGDVNRYSAIQIEIQDPAIAALRISGGYAIGDSLGFVESLSLMLPVEARQRDGKILLVRKANI